MKPSLRLDTGRDTFFASPYVKVTQLPTSTLDHQHVEDGHLFKSDRSRWQRVRYWGTSKGRGGGTRRLAVLALFGLLWLGLFVVKQRVSPIV